MGTPVQWVYDDLLDAQDLLGSEFLYKEEHGQLIAIQFDENGNELVRYRVVVSLEKQ